MNELDKLYSEWCEAAEAFESSIFKGKPGSQLEWRMDQAFMKFINKYREQGGNVDSKAIKRCLDRIVNE